MIACISRHRPMYAERRPSACAQRRSARSYFSFRVCGTAHRSLLPLARKPSLRGPLERDADLPHQVADDGRQRVAVIRIAGQCLDMGDELGAVRAHERRCEHLACTSRLAGKRNIYAAWAILLVEIAPAGRPRWRPPATSEKGGHHAQVRRDDRVRSHDKRRRAGCGDPVAGQGLARQWSAECHLPPSARLSNGQPNEFCTSPGLNFSGFTCPSFSPMPYFCRSRPASRSKRLTSCLLSEPRPPSANSVYLQWRSVPDV